MCRWPADASNLTEYQILFKFGKYLKGMSLEWNMRFCLANWDKQDELIFEEVDRFCKKNNFRLSDSDPFFTGVSLEQFDLSKDYDAVFFP